MSLKPSVRIKLRYYYPTVGTECCQNRSKNKELLEQGLELSSYNKRAPGLSQSCFVVVILRVEINIKHITTRNVCHLLTDSTIHNQIVISTIQVSVKQSDYNIGCIAFVACIALTF